MSHTTKARPMLMRKFLLGYSSNKLKTRIKIRMLASNGLNSIWNKKLRNVRVYNLTASFRFLNNPNTKLLLKSGKTQ